MSITVLASAADLAGSSPSNWNIFCTRANSGSRGTRADQGVCPTKSSKDPAREELREIFVGGGVHGFFEIVAGDWPVPVAFGVEADALPEDRIGELSAELGQEQGAFVIRNGAAHLVGRLPIGVG